MSIKAGVTASPPSASTIVLRATEGCHLLKIDGYSHARLLGNGECLKSTKFKAAGHIWCILFYPNGKSRMDHGTVSLYIKLVDRSKDVIAEVRFSVLPQRSVDGTLPYSKPEIIHKFESARRNNKCGFNWFIGVNELETLQHKYIEEDNDSIVVRCDIKVLNKPTVHHLSLQKLGLVCRCKDDTCKRLHDRSLESSSVKAQPDLNIKGEFFTRFFSCFLA
ncbi:hypothetical protein E2562_028645 [Oryza meyeriana var. granulata]|uniref:MATH domain-containing protein n=1 Tax=Oryza meyeriana var. granulata TaxID=110450 RepID=A0A6G1D7V0_9ORYZ|nr:hypothetical protein E2562_028645 [Oryza meyeriana var. granulata]